MKVHLQEQSQQHSISNWDLQGEQHEDGLGVSPEENKYEHGFSLGKGLYPWGPCIDSKVSVNDLTLRT